VPLSSEVVVDELFAGAFEAVGALLESQQSRIADEDGGVGSLEHGIEVGNRGQEGHVGVAPLTKKNAGVGQGGATGHVGGHGAQGMEPLGSAANQQQGTHTALGGDGASGQDSQAGRGGQSGDGDEANVRCARGQMGGALRGQHSVDLVAEGERVLQGRVLEVPHEGRGVEKTDGGNTQAGSFNHKF
jgi:hypothetical protein